MGGVQKAMREAQFVITNPTHFSVALAYAALRGAEGWGLWHDRAWAEWLAALSTGIYLPFELAHLLHRPGPAAALVLLLNVAVLMLMVARLRARRAAGD